MLRPIGDSVAPAPVHSETDKFLQRPDVFYLSQRLKSGVRKGSHLRMHAEEREKTTPA